MMIAGSPETREGMRNCRTKVNTPKMFLAAPDHSSVHSSSPSSSVHCRGASSQGLSGVLYIFDGINEK